MKKILLLTLLCWVSFASAQQTLFRVDCDDGNDGNDGTSWPGFLTLGAAEADDDFAAGDTVVSTGTCTESFAPTTDGTSGNKCFLLDSLVFADGFDPTLPDTSKLWSTIIDGGAGTRSEAMVFNNDDYWTIIGIDITGQGTNSIIFQALGLKAQQCRVRSMDTGTTNLKINNADTDSVISCLFLADAIYGIWDNTGTGSGGVYINNTVYGSFTNYAMRVDNTPTITIWRNNLLQNTSTNSNDLVILLDSGSQVRFSGSAVDNNLYWEATAITNAFSFNGANFDLLATWVDSVDNYATSGEANAKNEDPLLQSVTTTAFITSSSPAFEAGTDICCGDDIGWFQLVSSAAARRRIPSRVF